MIRFSQSKPVCCLWFVCFAVAARFTATSTFADQVVTRDGSTINGTVTRLADGAVTISTNYAGDVSVAAHQIASISTDERVAVTTANGERVVGRLQPGERGVVVAGSAMGDVVVPLENIASVETGENVDVPADVVAAVGRPEQLPEPSKWTVELEIGIYGESGNTESFDLRAALRAERIGEVERLYLYLTGEYGTDNGMETSNEYMAGLRLEHDVTTRLFVFGNIDLEYDKFEDIELRGRVTGGLGYFILRQDDRTLKVRAGIGGIFESFISGGTREGLIADFGVDYERQLAPWILLTHTTNIIPRLTDEFGEFRVESITAAEIPLDGEKVWRLRIGVDLEYDSDPTPGTDTTDVSYFATIVIDLK